MSIWKGLGNPTLKTASTHCGWESQMNKRPSMHSASESLRGFCCLHSVTAPLRISGQAREGSSSLWRECIWKNHKTRNWSCGKAFTPASTDRTFNFKFCGHITWPATSKRGTLLMRCSSTSLTFQQGVLLPLPHCLLQGRRRHQKKIGIKKNIFRDQKKHF